MGGYDRSKNESANDGGQAEGDAGGAQPGMQAAMIAQHRRRKIARKPLEEPDGSDSGSASPTAALPDQQREGLKEILPYLSDFLSDKKNDDMPFVESLRETSEKTAGLIENGTAEEQAESLLLNWVVELPSHPDWIGDKIKPPEAQVMALEFLRTATEQRKATLKNPDPKLDGFLTRIHAMRSFYASMTTGIAAAGDTPEQAPVSGQRQAFVGLALSKVGMVNAAVEDEVDDDGKPARHGWRTLLEIWNAAYGGEYPKPEVIKHKNPGKKAVQDKTKPGNIGQVDTDDVMGSWCGIFPTAIARTIGVPGVPTWEANGIAALKPTQAPKVGDVGNRADATNHFGIITWIEPYPAGAVGETLKRVKVRTVEGNTEGGQILEHEGTIADWSAGIFSLGD